MDHIGIDVPKRESQICILAEGGELIEQRIRTEPDRFASLLGTRPRAHRILIEASTDSECAFLSTSILATASITRSMAAPPGEVTRPRTGAFAALLCSTGSEAPMRGSGRSLVSFFPDSR